MSIQSETHKTSMRVDGNSLCCCTGVNIKNSRSLDSGDHHKIKKVPWPGLYFETHVLSNERLCDFCATESLGAHVFHRKTWMEISNGLTFWNLICFTLICLLIVVLLELFFSAVFCTHVNIFKFMQDFRGSAILSFHVTMLIFLGSGRNKIV